MGEHYCFVTRFNELCARCEDEEELYTALEKRRPKQPYCLLAHGFHSFVMYSFLAVNKTFCDCVICFISSTDPFGAPKSALKVMDWNPVPIRDFCNAE